MNWNWSKCGKCGHEGLFPFTPQGQQTNAGLVRFDRLHFREKMLRFLT
jgi:hypothetical protein